MEFYFPDAHAEIDWFKGPVFLDQELRAVVRDTELGAIEVFNKGDLFRIIDWMMRLPEELEQQLWHEIETIEENQKMQYVTSVERFEIAKVQQEIAKVQQEIAKVKQKCVLEGEQKTLRRQLQRRFQLIPDWAEERILQGSEAELEQWLDNVLDATAIESVFTEQLSSH